MRVTNRMSFDQAQAQMMAARDRAMKAQQQVTSACASTIPATTLQRRA